MMHLSMVSFKLILLEVHGVPQISEFMAFIKFKFSTIISSIIFFHSQLFLLSWDSEVTNFRPFNTVP